MGEYIAYFFVGAFLVNAVPHFVHGVSGHPFQTPFASPPGKGLSTSVVNVLWAAFNFTASYLFAHWAGFDPHDGTTVAISGLGALLMALISAHIFGKLHGGDLK